MGRRQDGFRDRPVEGHLLAMQGLGDLIGLLEGHIPRSLMALKERASLFAISFLDPNSHRCRIILSMEQGIGENRGTTKHDVVNLDIDG